MAATTLDFSAFSTPAKLQEAIATAQRLNCGWIPPDERTSAVKKAAEEALLSFAAFNIRGRFSAAERRYPLWKAGKIANGGKFLRYNWQQTGSCVGAGGGNMLKTLLAVQIALGGSMERLMDVWWPFNYGRSRFYSGIRGKGEGSTGSGWAKGITTDGFFEIDPTGLPDLPDFKDVDGWLVEPPSVEMEWSDGARIGEQWLKVAKSHMVKTAARIRNKDEAFEAIANGYPLTQASMFGFRTAKVKGTDFPIRVAIWDGTWSHQTYVDEVWDHPELKGIYYRWGNNWGPDAHGKPTGDEPPGGVYIHETIMDRLCKEGEVYAFSHADGFPAQELNFNAF